MKTITVRNIPVELATALETEKRRRGLSLNRTVVLLIQEALGIAARGRRSNGLHKLAGTWSEEEFRSFEKATAPLREIDAEIWK